jgi:hypothetical protein
MSFAIFIYSKDNAEDAKPITDNNGDAVTYTTKEAAENVADRYSFSEMDQNKVYKVVDMDLYEMHRQHYQDGLINKTELERKITDLLD